MARLARAEVFDPNEVAVLHVMARVTRRCFLLGFDSVSGKNFDHRKIWIEDQLRLLAANFIVYYFQSGDADRIQESNNSRFSMVSSG